MCYFCQGRGINIHKSLKSLDERRFKNFPTDFGQNVKPFLHLIFSQMKYPFPNLYVLIFVLKLRSSILNLNSFLLSVAKQLYIS